MPDFQILPDQPAARPAPPPRGKWATLLQQLLDAGLAPGVVKTVKVPGGDTARVLACAGLKRASDVAGRLNRNFETWWHVDAWPHSVNPDLIQVEMLGGARPGRKEVGHGEE